MVEFEMDGRQYRFDKLSAMQQFHVSRKIAPLLPPLLPIFAQVVKEKKGKKPLNDLDKIGPLLQPFADGLASMSDDVSEYVFNTCLSVIRCKHGDNWIQFWSATGKIAMVEELNDVGVMIRLVVRVIQDSLAPFINGFLTNAGEPDEGQRSEDFPEGSTGS
jgi:hypothetical protein